MHLCGLWALVTIPLAGFLFVFLKYCILSFSVLFSNYACWHGKHTSITFFIFNLYYSSRFNTSAALKTWKVFPYLSTKNAPRANTDCKLRLTPAVREPSADTLRRVHQPSRHEGAPLLQNSCHISPFLGEDYRLQGHQGSKTSIHPPRPAARQGQRYH